MVKRKVKNISNYLDKMPQVGARRIIEGSNEFPPICTG
jgi:hypothetical protein